MAARRGKTQARRNSSSQGTPGWVWLVAGVAIAAVVFLAAPNLFKGEGDGFLRAGPQPNPNAQPAPVADADSDVGSQPAAQPATIRLGRGAPPVHVAVATIASGSRRGPDRPDGHGDRSVRHEPLARYSLQPGPHRR